ncbi:MAG: crotonase/enoyl-CoA hydratase family protein, partial [Solirubrobacterales bacterium]
MSDPERVRVTISDHIADVVLSRPDSHNGLDYRMFEAINDAIDEVRSDPSVRAVVLSGEGRSFCAGLDFKSVLAEGRPIEDSFVRREGEIANEFQRVAYGWQEVPAPVIAALQGNCLGGGCQIALAADMRIAATDLKLSVLEIKWGLIPDMGLTQSLTRLVGIDIAKELTFTGRIVGATEAQELGLITRVAEDPLAAARELAAEIATRSPDAIRRDKRLFERSWNASAAEALALEEELQRELLGSPNQLAAVQAALSGEPPAFADPS